jgi:PAS domain S-box-containing protein
MSIEDDGQDARAALVARFRQFAARQCADVIGHPDAEDPAYRADAFPRLVGLFASCLEELRVVEEQLQSQGHLLNERDAELQARVERERRLFDLAPVALLVTDAAGTIVDTNKAATALLGIDGSDEAARRPLLAIVPASDRDAFRAELSRLGVARGARDWRFRITRRRDVPVAVTAAVSLGPYPERRQRGDALYWCLRPVSDASSNIDAQAAAYHLTATNVDAQSVVDAM